MLYLLDKDVKTVKWNGIPLHEASSAIVKEETNGDFTLTIRYPITDSSIYQLIKEDMLIKAPTPVLGPQLFRIKKPVENDDSLDITAYHISDDVMQRSITPVSVVGQGCAMALSQMVQNAKTDLGTFSFTSDIMDSRTFNTTETETLYTVLMDGKHSIVGTWEGELVRDNFALTVKRSRGADRGVVVTTHKNLKSYQRTKNSQSVVTRIHARSTFRAEGAETDTVLAVTVDSPLIGNYPYINEKEYENNNAKTVDELRKWAEAKFKHEGIDKISDAIEIEAYELDGQVIHLGDTVNIKSRKHDVDIYKKAIAYEYNALTEEYISITFDDKPGVGGSGVSSGLSNAADVILGVNANAQEIAVERAIRNANQAFDAEFDKRVESIHDGIEQAKAEAELYADNIKQSIDADINAVTQSMEAQSEEHDRQVADILAKTQSVEEARAQFATVSQAINTAKTELQTAIASVDQKARDSQASATALRNDLNLQASKILEQAQAQTDLTNRVTTVETLADGTRSTVAELSKTVSKATGDIASVTSRTKIVEDTLGQTRTQYEALTQTVNAQTGQIDSINRKTADLQSGIDGVTERFESLRVGGRNLIPGTASFSGTHWEKGGTWRLEESLYKGAGVLTWVSGNKSSPIANISVQSGDTYTFSAYIKKENAGTVYFYLYDAGEMRFATANVPRETLIQNVGDNFQRFTITFRITRSGLLRPRFAILSTDEGGFSVAGYQLETGTLATDWSPAPEDIHSEIATYKRTAEETSAELSRQIQLADGKAVEAKSYAQQTADTIKTRLESLETYKDGESTRASQYLTASREETARQLEAERTSISANYVAKSTYTEDVRGTTQRLNEIKTTADTAKQNLATYQNTVDRKLTELTSTTQTLDGKVSTASAKVDTVAGQIRTEISEVEGKIPTSIGGRNLIPGTASFSGTHWEKLSTWRLEESLYKGAGILTWVSGMKSSPIANISVQSGDTYTFSAYIKKENAGTVYFYLYDAGEMRFATANVPRETSIQNVGDNFQRFTITFRITRSGLLRPRFAILSTDEGGFSVAGYQLETGTLATDWSPAPEDLATVTALHNVTDTVDSHTRTIGAVGTAGSILDNVSKVTQTAAGLVTEVSGTNGLKTQVSQLSGSYAIKNLTNSGMVLNQLNLNKDGSVKIDGNLVQITGTTYIQDGVISSAKIGSLDAGKITTGTLDAARIKASSIDGSKLVFDQAFFTGLTANEAYLKQLFAKDAFITQVQAVTLSASKIAGGILTATNEAMEVNLNNGQILYYTDQAAMKRILSGYPTQFIKFDTGTYGGKPGGVTVIGSNRDGSENPNNGSFAGIRIWNGIQSDGSFFDKMDIGADDVQIGHKVFDDGNGTYRGWQFKSYGEGSAVSLFPYGNYGRATITATNYRILNLADNTYVNLEEVLNKIFDNFNNLNNNGNYQRSFYSSWR